jgi:uncharacterized protein (TIGR03435 family)
MEVWPERVTIAALGALAFLCVVINARMLLITASLQPWLGALPSWKVYPALHIVVDPGWLIAMRYRAEGGSDIGVFFGSSVMLAIAWMSATTAGHFAGALITDPRLTPATSLADETARLPIFNDINAKANIEFRPSPDGPARELLLMIRSVLQERFKLKTHMETRELPIYELVLARADRRLGPEMRKPAADCDAAIAAGIPPPRQPGEPPPCGLMGGPARTIAGGATIQQLAANLSVRLERLVFDKTRLAGRFAFNLAWTPDRMPTADPPPGIPPIDPNGPSLFTALQEQLGLKLEPAKGPVDVLVIDSVEHPTED